MNAIVIRDCTKKLNDVRVLDTVNAEFTSGVAYGIVGKNGSGKSMLFKAICGFVRLDSGMIFVNEQVVGKDIDFPQDIGFVIESPGFIEETSGLQNLRILASIRERITDDQVCASMNLVGLDPDDRKAVKKYSTGMRQRLAIAQALMEDPPILILDEPFNGIDKKGVTKIQEILLDQKQKGKMLLLSSHLPDDIALICDRVFEMEEGRLASITQ